MMCIRTREAAGSLRIDLPLAVYAVRAQVPGAPGLADLPRERARVLSVGSVAGSAE